VWPGAVPVVIEAVERPDCAIQFGRALFTSLYERFNLVGAIRLSFRQSTIMAIMIEPFGLKKQARP
jgi:hypothetical protein